MLYSREAILQSLLQQKKANKRKFAAWQSEQEDELQKVQPLNLHVLGIALCGSTPTTYTFAVYINLLACQDKLFTHMDLSFAQANVQMQEEERLAVADRTKLLAFDKQNHMGASDKSARSLSAAIQDEAEILLKRKKVVSGAVNIQTNNDSIKVQNWDKIMYILTPC